MGKPNPWLAAQKAKMEEEFLGRLHCHEEIDVIATLLAANESLEVGPGRAGGFLEARAKALVEVADLINADGEADKDLIYAKKVLADNVKRIVGRETWEKLKVNLPLLREYWEWDA